MWWQILLRAKEKMVKAHLVIRDQSQKKGQIGQVADMASAGELTPTTPRLRRAESGRAEVVGSARTGPSQNELKEIIRFGVVQCVF